MKNTTYTRLIQARSVGSYSYDGPDFDDRPYRVVVSGGTRDNGYKLMDWRKRIARGESAITTLSGTKTEIDFVRGTNHRAVVSFLKYGTSNLWRDVEFSLVGVPALARSQAGLTASVSAEKSKARAKAVKAFYKTVKDFNQAFDGGVALAELRETLHMLRNPGANLKRLLAEDYVGPLAKRYKGWRKTSQSKELLRAIRSEYLQQVYGWLPFMSDVASAREALSRINEEAITRHKFTVTGYDEASKPPSALSGGGDSWWWHYGEAHEKARWKARFRGLLERKIDGFDPKALNQYRAQQAGLTLSQFVPTLWEWLPWSFLADYFTNIGDILEQSYVDTGGVRWCEYTELEWQDRYVTVRPDEKAFKSYLDPLTCRLKLWKPGVSSRVRTRKSYFQRYSDIPAVQDFAFELPGKPQQWTNMLALWSQANDVYPQRPIYRYRGPKFRS